MPADPFMDVEEKCLVFLRGNTRYRIPEALRRYNLLSRIRYPLALRARHHVSVLLSCIVPS
jgi:hypothetical protein